MPRFTIYCIFFVITINAIAGILLGKGEALEVALYVLALPLCLIADQMAVMNKQQEQWFTSPKNYNLFSFNKSDNSSASAKESSP